jgi:hypothetical protein
MKALTLLFILFLFTGAKPASKSAAPIVKSVPLDNQYEQLPERLDQLSKKMEALSSNVEKLK